MINKTFTTTLLPLNQLNGNGRIYEDNENLRKSIEEFNNKNEEVGVTYGEFGYPESFDASLTRASHTIKNVRIEDDKVIGDITLLNTEHGKILQDLFKQDDPGVVVRPRATGITRNDGTVTIQKIYTYDVINSSEDSFNEANVEKYKKYKIQMGKKPEIQGRVVSELDPYGEENWDEK